MSDDEDSSVDDDSTIDTPPPPPPSDIDVAIPGGYRKGNTPYTSQTDDAKYHKQFRIFKGMAPNYSDAPSLREEDEDFDEDDRSDGDEGDKENPPPKNIDRMGGASPFRKKKLHGIKKPFVYGVIAACLLLIIIIILSVGIATNAFQGGDGDAPSSLSSPSNMPEENERASRLRQYLMSVGEGPAKFNDPISPESQALAWMQYEDPVVLDPIDFDNHIRIDQRFALLTLWFQSDFEWFDQTNWLSEDECTWYGVACILITPGSRRNLIQSAHARMLQEGDRVVTELVLPGNNLQGRIPPDISLLHFLQTLNLEKNNFGGPIPESMWNVTSVQRIRFNDNNFTGTISENIGNLVNLVTFTAGGNQLIGTFPQAFGSLENLVILHLNSNAFAGELPDGLSDLPNLRSLDVRSNKLSGTASSFSNSKRLIALLLGDNNFSGEINLEGLDALEVVNIENNNFIGILPTFSGATNIHILRLGGNDFEGKTFPAYLFAMKNLTDIGLNGLSLTGTIPTGVGGWAFLERLDLANNLFSGTIPFSLADPSLLKELSLSSNQLTGSIPFEFSFLRRLERLALSSNRLESTLPSSLGALVNLKALELNKNSLTGTLPVLHGDLTNIQVYDVSDNSGLEGTLPPEFLNMQHLRELHIFGTTIEGAIPTGFCENEVFIKITCRGQNGTSKMTSDIACSCCACA